MSFDDGSFDSTNSFSSAAWDILAKVISKIRSRFGMKKIGRMM